MSTAALVNARASNGSGSTVQTAQLHQQSFGNSMPSIGLSSKKTDEKLLQGSFKTEVPASDLQSAQVKEETQVALADEEPKGTIAAKMSLGDTDGKKMYPDDIRNILIEVARTGKSTTLHWTETAETSVSHQDSGVARRPHQVSHSEPPPKKQRNGIYIATNRPGLKRPLSSRLSGGSNHLSPAHSSRTSASELEDTSQYDSEGTSNSEFSMDRARAQHLLNGVLNGLIQKQTNGSKLHEAIMKRPQPSYNSLREVFRLATASVLDYFFEKRGGYKLTPAEERYSSILASSNQKEGDLPPSSAATASSGEDRSLAEEVFKQRKQRVLNLLGDSKEINASVSTASAAVLGPPFTMQRIAEVLLTPERYYTQTHKLCNCLEKLLLVTSSIQAFGGSTGGNSSQSRREEQEMAALADERSRLLSEYRRRRLQRSTSGSSEGDGQVEFSSDLKQAPASPRKVSSPVGRMGTFEARKNDKGNAEASNEALQKEDLLEAARASLRTKFDHVGIDPHSAVATANRDHQASGNRSMTNSPPPPGYSVGAAPGMGLAGHAHGGLMRAHSHEEHPGSPNSPLVIRTSSPILFKSTPDGASSPKKASPIPIHPTHQNLQLLQMHHAAALAGVSPFDLMASLTAGGHQIPSQHAGTLGSITLQPSSAMMLQSKDMDVESRSSASSDVDSESDDVSFDDSASDRSDSSDSNEPVSNPVAARALALNLAQQQHHPPQSQRRVLGSNSSSAFNMGQRAPLQPYKQTLDTLNASSGNAVANRPIEAEYQSGDSVDSLRAEDSDSSSEMAD